MKRHDKLRNLHEALFALDKEIKNICRGIEQRLRNNTKYMDTYERVLTEVEFERKNEMYGRSTIYDFERMRINLEQDAGNLIYEAINVMGNDEFIIRRQNVIFAFWFMGQFDVYALDLSRGG
ncbi:hypothetical protein SCORR_v1c01980 [Spiroplasma corruscae]|uniref:Uncharacterized protein n=1 Tax=Spiroplasma corruscae TaxID=216934 RepID=A0A222ENV6_9MOLU|nr:hypothetical protein [Spiroplasma corruscae]ASP27973.1 hypothetical protein SCORR_v1c01980 [Spiroplasma corruscae]